MSIRIAPVFQPRLDQRRGFVREIPALTPLFLSLSVSLFAVSTLIVTGRNVDVYRFEVADDYFLW